MADGTRGILDAKNLLGTATEGDLPRIQIQFPATQIGALEHALESRTLQGKPRPAYALCTTPEQQ